MSSGRHGRARPAETKSGKGSRTVLAGRAADRYLQPGERAIAPDYSSAWVKASLERKQPGAQARPDAQGTDSSREPRAGVAVERLDGAKGASRTKPVKELLKRNLEVSLEACRLLAEKNRDQVAQSHSECSPSLSLENRLAAHSKTRSSSLGRRAELGSRINRVGSLKPADFEAGKNPKAVLRRRKASAGTSGSQKFLGKRPKHSSSEERAASEVNSLDSHPADPPADLLREKTSKIKKTGRGRGRPRLDPSNRPQPAKKQEKKNVQKKVAVAKAASVAERSKRLRKTSTN